MKGAASGFILITTFAMVLVLTVIVLGIISLNTTQTRIAANSADELVSFQTAEGALNQATNNLLNGNYSSSSFNANTAGLYVFDATADPLPTTINWTNADQVILSYQGNSNAQSAFIIEKLPPGIQSGQNMNTTAWSYRITARAVGTSGNSPVILQSTVQIQY